MSSPGWRPEDDDRASKKPRFGEALAELAVEETPEVAPVEAVRKSREDV